MKAPEDPANNSTPKKGLMTGLPSVDMIRSKLEQSETPYTAEQIGTVIWFLSYARQAGVKSYAEMGDLIGRDPSTISRLLNGNYGASIESVCERIENFREVMLERSKVGEIPFIKTRLAEEIWNFCDFTRISMGIGLIHGPNQSGKTVALEEYQRRNNHGKTTFVRMPAGGSCSIFIDRLCKASGISPGSNPETPLNRLHKHYRSDQLIIVDEAHQLFVHGLKTRTIETLRELHDLTKVPMLLCGTDVLADAMRNPRWQAFIGQLDNRSDFIRKIRAKPYRSDVLLFCESFGFGHPAKGSQEEREVFQIANTNGLGKLSRIFRMAQRYAAKKGEPVSWRAFLATIAYLSDARNGGKEEDEE